MNLGIHSGATTRNQYYKTFRLVIYPPFQGTLTEGEGLVQQTSLLRAFL
jgi:hypothetical protein